MKDLRRKSRESGIALLLAIFTLLLLTAMGLTLLSAADLETNIAANYRDKQVAMYGALSGLQEARDRLDPSLCDPNKTAIGSCPGPAIDMRKTNPADALPSLTNGGIVYILNPSNGETVAPWDSSNPYFDTELCMENILGLTPVAGASCPVSSSSVPSGSQWYTTYTDTQSLAGMYKTGSGTYFPTPLPYKWVRISVKTDQMTPAHVSWSTTGSTVECWDGHHQVPATTANGYNPDCSSLHGIQLYYSNGTVCGNNGTDCTFNPALGSGYTNNSPVSFSGGSATNVAQATAYTANGGEQVIAVNVTNPGSGYSNATTTVQLSGGGGSGATAVPVIGGSVSSLTDVSWGTNPVGCYAAAPSVVIGTTADGYGSGAAATANMTGPTCIAKFSLTYTSGKCDQTGNGVQLGTADGGGSGFSATVDISTNNGGKSTGFSNVQITNPGSGYTTTPTTLTGLTGCTYTLGYTLGTQIQSSGSFAVSPGGSGYDETPPVTITAPTSGGPNPPTTTASVTSSSTSISSITVTNPGSGYTSAPTVTISDTGSGKNADATATVSASTGGISEIKLTSAGSGYKSDPTVNMPPGGSGASLTAHVSSGSSAGRVFVLTALAETPGKSRSITQMEAATQPSVPFSIPGALTLNSPNATVLPPTSASFTIDGTDQNSCGETQTPKASIGIDVPPTSTATTVACITSQLGGAPDASCSAANGVKPKNFPGDLASPDVEDVYNSLGDLTTPAGCDALATAIADKATYTYNETGGTPVKTSGNFFGSYPNNCPIIVVNGDLNLKGNGCGVLLVTGNINIVGNYTWNGPVFIIGSGGSFIAGGGGNGVINGSLFVAQDKDSSGNLLPTLGTSSVIYNAQGGGTNNVYYDHCKSDDWLRALGLNSITPIQALQVLSVRTIY